MIKAAKIRIFKKTIQQEDMQTSAEVNIPVMMKINLHIKELSQRFCKVLLLFFANKYFRGGFWNIKSLCVCMSYKSHYATKKTKISKA